MVCKIQPWPLSLPIFDPPPGDGDRAELAAVDVGVHGRDLRVAEEIAAACAEMRRRDPSPYSGLLRSTSILDLFSGGLQDEFDQGGGEALLPRPGLGEVDLEAVDEGHQFVDFGDDAVLFGEGRNREW